MQANHMFQSIMLSANHSAYGFNNFYPSIVRGFNLGSNTITLICTAPPYLVGALITFAMAYNSDRLGERGWHIIISMSVAITGFIISVATLNGPARYFASFLYIAGCFTGNSLVFAWGASTTSQTPEKRACATAIINVLGQAGNIW
jgi:nitrate/nitrite transporter NarK